MESFIKVRDEIRATLIPELKKAFQHSLISV
jgi:hypothetical protein